MLEMSVSITDDDVLGIPAFSLSPVNSIVVYLECVSDALLAAAIILNICYGFNIIKRFAQVIL
jgi:hypothetical protein